MRFFFLLLCSFLLTIGCDDGDKIDVSFDFANATVQKCTSGFTLYKISDDEALVLNTNEINFPNTEGTKTVNIDASSSLVYKKYESTTNSTTICGTPTLSVIEEWNAIGGTMEIVSTKIFSTSNPSEVIAYNHKITFKNITFSAPNKQVVFDVYEFGNYKTDIVDLKFDYTTSVTQKCSANNLIFKFNSNNVLLFDVDAQLFSTTLGEKTAVINSVNKVIYRVYNGGLNTAFFCSSIPSSNPVLTEEWVAENGVIATSGIIKVVTTQQTATTYKHTIKLFNTTFKKGIQTYSPAPGTDYEFGELITN